MTIFIVLIHPIQWTIALPVGATGPPNVRKRRPVYNTSRAGQESAFARCRLVLPCCLDNVTSWHLFRLARGE